MSDIFSTIFSGMGSGRDLVGLDLLQSQQIREADSTADMAASQANRATERSVEAELNVERLRLVTQAMWEFLRERTEITDADLEAKIQEIDLRDGSSDGEMARQVAICGHGQRKTGVRSHRRCFYCGTQLEKQHVVER